MCGICGIVEARGKFVSCEILKGMTNAMRHRGPNEDGYYQDVEVGFGFRRLSVIDLEHGHQPMTNEDSLIWVVFNGEIYNYRALREDLVGLGHRFRTNADTEVLVHLYEEYGMEFITRLRGMFAFAIYDKRSGDVFLVRDYFGIKPLYYSINDGVLAFASELRSLFASRQVSRNINPQSLWDYFTFQYVPDPDTMFSDVSKLPPAHYMHFKNGTASLHRYWSITFQPDESKPLEYFTEQIESALRDSVKVHMQSDVPVGAFLSSGIDSSAIVALMRESKQNVKTFSIGFENARAGMNELEEARRTASYLGTEHVGIHVSTREFQMRLEALISALEEPIGDASALALYYLSERAREDVTVVLSGEGADELFGGYPIYHEPISLQMFRFMPNWLRESAKAVSNAMPVGMKGKSFLHRGSLPLERRFIGNAQLLQEDRKQQLLRINPFDVQTSFARTDSIYQTIEQTDEITKMQLVDLNLWLPGDILAKADKMTMANSIEQRVPFLDKKVFEVAARIPAKYRIAGAQTKFALRRAMQGILPAETCRRPKLGFPVPTRNWIRSEMRDFVWDILVSDIASDVLNHTTLCLMMEEHCDGIKDWGRELWAAVTFLLWYESFIHMPSLNAFAKEYAAVK